MENNNRKGDFMFSIKVILGGIGFLVFSICCILIKSLINWDIWAILCVIALIIGITLVIGGLLNSDNNK